MSSLLLSVDDAVISAAFTEQAGERVDISFRARPGYDVATLALELGGGGHTLASGCTVYGPVSEVVRSVVAALQSQTMTQTAGEE